MDKYRIEDVADFFLKIVDRESESTITPLKLQKILYYAQGYYLAIHDKELFPEEFEAWAHGPVNEEIYNKYRDYGYQSIPEPEYEIKEFSKEFTSIQISGIRIFLQIAFLPYEAIKNHNT